MTLEFYLEKFEYFSDLLFEFNSDLCGENTPDKEVILKVVSEHEVQDIRRMLAEGKEVLAIPIKDFPDNWIRTITCNLPYITVDGVNRILESTKENYYKWVKQTVETLEAEAKRQGKL